MVELINIEVMVHLIMTAHILHNFCILHNEFHEDYFAHSDDDSDDDSEDGGCVGLDGCAAGGLDGVRLAEAKRIQLMNVIC